MFTSCTVFSYNERAKLRAITCRLPPARAFPAQRGPVSLSTDIRSFYDCLLMVTASGYLAKHSLRTNYLRDKLACHIVSSLKP